MSHSRKYSIKMIKSLPESIISNKEKKQMIKAMKKAEVNPKSIKRKGDETKRETPQYTCKKGSVTLEAAVILPLLACLFTAFLFFFKIMQVEIIVQDALERTGRTLAIYSVVEKETETDAETDTGIVNLIIARTMFGLNLGNEAIIEQYVTGAKYGISLMESSLDGDYIFLKANYQMKFPVQLLGKHKFSISQQTKWRKWTGWHRPIEAEEDTIVYIAETGTVYHQVRDCPYLDLSIKSINVDIIEEMRNESGEKYKSCGQCADKNINRERVYITNYGNRFHYDLNCSGIKRTILQKYLSEVKEMGACSKCWN